MKDFLAAKEIKALLQAHKREDFRRFADRIKSILMLNRGVSYEEISRSLLLDETTIRRYEKQYKEKGLEGLLEDHYTGSVGTLSILEEEALVVHLREHTYHTVKAIVAYVEKAYRINYSIAGMTHLLHRLQFVYKKTKVLPGKVDLEKQEVFKQEYQGLKETKQPGDKIYFVDASHPQHNNRPFYGWIHKGETKAIKTNTGRKRVNLNGAVNVEDMDILVLSEPTINTEAMKRLILRLEQKQPEGKIHMIVDNARYNHSRELKRFLTEHSRVQLHYLPAYSPNLNIIERLWKFFHEKHYDQYFEKFYEFEQEVLTFFRNIHQYDDELKSLLTDSFQTFPT